MFNIDGTTISLTRGDTLCLNINLTKDGEAYVPSEYDVITFSLKKSFKDNIYLINKKVTKNDNDQIIVEILPSDTKPLSFGSYKYDMQIKDENNRVYTFVVGDFILTEEVT